jgi:hypothetical protein
LGACTKVNKIPDISNGFSVISRHQQCPFKTILTKSNFSSGFDAVLLATFGR